MKTKYFCRRCGEQLPGDGGYCHVCRENKGDADVEERYFPDDPKNRVYAVDAYVTVVKCFKVEARDKNAAEDIARKMIDDAMLPCMESETCAKLSDMGFHYGEERECVCNGDAEDDGNIRYY